MPEQNEKRKNGVQRYFITSQRTSSLRVITFDRLARKEHVVRIVDLSVIGMGIESNDPIESGLACFGDRVGGHKLGVVTWCRQNGDSYRAGINFITLPREKEQYILNQVKQSPSHKCLRDPEKIIETLLQSIKPETDS